MLYIVYGDDRMRQKIYIDNIKELYPSYIFSTIERSDFSKQSFEQTIFGESLFGETQAVVLDGVCELKDNREYLVQIKQELQTSPNIILLQEQSLDLDFIKEIEGIAQEIVVYKTAPETPDFTLWSAVYARDKKAAWQAYIQISKKEASEKTHAGILSQVKNMYKIHKATKGSTFKDLGFAKEGSYQSALRGANKYTENEVFDMLYELSMMSNQAHAGEVDFKLALESFILRSI